MGILLWQTAITSIKHRRVYSSSMNQMNDTPPLVWKNEKPNAHRKSSATCDETFTYHLGRHFSKLHSLSFFFV